MLSVVVVSVVVLYGIIINFKMATHSHFATTIKFQLPLLTIIKPSLGLEAGAGGAGWGQVEQCRVTWGLGGNRTKCIRNLCRKRAVISYHRCLKTRALVSVSPLSV